MRRRRAGSATPTAKSGTGRFEVDTEPPVVTIDGPPSPSNNTKPSFSGTASENTEVVVHVFEGAEEVASAKTTASGGNGPRALEQSAAVGQTHVHGEGDREERARQRGRRKRDRELRSGHRTAGRDVRTAAERRRTTRTPSFEGAASENTEVVVHVFEGATEVASAKTTPPAGTGRRAALSKALPSGKHSFTAKATEKSGIGERGRQERNGRLRSQHASAGRHDHDSPPARSNNTNPSFSGTASENTEVVVHVFEGATKWRARKRRRRVANGRRAG